MSDRNASRDESVEAGDKSVEAGDESIEAGEKTPQSCYNGSYNLASDYIVIVYSDLYIPLIQKYNKTLCPTYR